MPLMKGMTIFDYVLHLLAAYETSYETFLLIDM